MMDSSSPLAGTGFGVVLSVEAKRFELLLCRFPLLVPIMRDARRRRAATSEWPFDNSHMQPPERELRGPEWRTPTQVKCELGRARAGTLVMSRPRARTGIYRARLGLGLASGTSNDPPRASPRCGGASAAVWTHPSTPPTGRAPGSSPGLTRPHTCRASTAMGHHQQHTPGRSFLISGPRGFVLQKKQTRAPSSC